jgi:diguanylate cyclase (GGDEF)-like protein
MQMQIFRDAQDGINPAVREWQRKTGVAQSRNICQLEGYSTKKYMDNRAKHLGAMRDLLATLAESASGQHLLQASIDALLELLQVQYGAISLHDELGNLARFVYAGINAEQAQQIIHPPKGSGLLGKVVRENVVLRLDNMEDDPRRAGFPANHPPMTSLLAIPISNLGRMYGRIYLCDKRDRNAFSDEDEQLVVNFANALSLILDNERKLAELKHKQNQLAHSALHDPLTNLPNRVLFSDRIGQVLSQAHRNQTQAAVLFCDLDDFKAINDSMGHQAGDQVLKTMSERLLNCVRVEDTVARFGGDEFVFVLSNVESVEHTKVVAQKILDVMAQGIYIDGCEIRLSVSVGIAIFPFDGDISERLIRNADSAMYKAKECGKNNYRFFSGPLPAG